MKIVHAYVYDPTGPSLFKRDKNEKARCTTISCGEPDRCELLDRDECLCLGMFAPRCPHGHRNVTTGWTRRAAKFRQWIRDMKERYADVPSLKTPSKVMARVGDYVYLPYSHMTMDKESPFLSHATFGSTGTPLVPREDFGVELLRRLCEFVPRTIFDYRPIPDYQEKEVPLFVRHLQEREPVLFAELCEAYPRAREIADAWTDVGRKARLRSLRPNVGEFVDRHGGRWTWDGEWLVSRNPKASFVLVNEIEEMRIRPAGDPEVTVTDQGQVGPDTAFTT